jgi:hypothetical protein
MSDGPTLMSQMIVTAAKAEWAAIWPNQPWESMDSTIRDQFMAATAKGLSSILPLMQKFAEGAVVQGLDAAFEKMKIEYGVHQDLGDDHYVLIKATSEEHAKFIVEDIEKGHVVTRRVTAWAVQK